nr:MAG TPA: DNA-directed RNA polymerase subunit [Caudoviricetes sp.]
MEETTVKKINTVSVNSKTFSGHAMVYRCTTCQSLFVDMHGNYPLCPYCGRKIIGTEN